MTLCILVVASGCGRLGFDATPEDDPGDDDPVQVTVGVDPMREPKACMSSTLGTVAFTAPPVDITVAPTPTGATLLWTQLGGGMRGLRLDPQGTVLGNPSGTQLRTDPWIKDLAATYVDGVLISVAQDGVSCVEVDILAPDLSGFDDIAHLSQIHAPKIPIVKVGTGRAAATSFSDGVTITPFDAAWDPKPTKASFPSDAATSIAASAYLDRAVVAWSTSTACNIATVLDTTSSMGGWDTTPCASPRLASSPHDLVFAFESPEGIRATRGTPAALRMPVTSVLAKGTAPRVVFDGARYWVGYLDPTGHLVVGYIDADGSLQTSTLPMSPMSHDYELVVMDGAPWVIAAVDGAFTAEKLCLP